MKSIFSIGDIKESIHNLKSQIATADNYFFEWYMQENTYKEPSWLIEICFLQLLAISEALELYDLRTMIYDEYSAIKSSESGLSGTVHDRDGEPYSLALTRIRRYVRSLESFFPKEAPTAAVRFDFLALDLITGKTGNTVYN